MSSYEYSIVVPIYNDAELAEEFVLEFAATFKECLDTNDLSEKVELLFVNDGSEKPAQDILNSIARRFDFVRIIELSRYFGHHIALTCGYERSRGNYVGMLNVDMEDPPNQIPALLNHLKAGPFDIVTALRSTREKSFFRDQSSIAFHKLLNFLTGFKMPAHCSTLRVMNRRFVDAYCLLKERLRHIPGIEMWLGFNHGYLPIKQNPRKRGKSSYNIFKRAKLAFESTLSFSDFPLRLIIYFGIFIATVGFLLALGLVVKKLFYENLSPGYTSTLATIVLMSGLQVGILGMIGLYIGRVLREVLQRPVYVIKTDTQETK